ncbi:cholinesterase-like [Ptychodera flava]|uniref:cholinesterase-like n=1 Tax=Ptychodera flava TaxID=63121 RepID=UPI00396A9FA3
MFVRFVVLLAVMGLSAADDPMVEVKAGKIVGKSVQFAHKDVDVERTVHVYKGIPYAEAPVGDLRFRAPQPKGPWDGVQDATKVGYACIQYQNPLFHLEEPQSEDCLYLNVYVPQTDSGPLPVMVWIHGGAFTIGSGTHGDAYDATALASMGDVIVVSFNYRLGVFGFFATGDEHAPGNYGLLDQVAALEWVQQNIAAFGGDASKVTIFGESAGSISVEYLVLSPLTNGLFHRAIMQSGSATFPAVTSDDVPLATKISQGLGKVLGCERDTTEELVQCLRKVPADDFREPNDISTGVLANVTGLGSDMSTIPFSPFIDGHFLTEMPKDQLTRGAITKTDVDLIIGTNADEGTMFLPVLFPNSVNDTEISMDRATYEQTYAAFLSTPLKKSQAVLDAVKLMYVNWENADSDDADYIEALNQMLGDYLFVCPSVLSARAYSNAGNNVYVYHMTHVPAKSIWPIKWMKATHGEDLQFVFGGVFGSKDWSMPKEEVTMSLQTMKYWTNFAKTGDPNLSGTGEDSSLKTWPLFKVPGLEYKELSLQMENKRALKADECAFWNDFIPKLMKLTEVDTVCSAADDETKKYTEEGNKP